jgi:competence protein ComEC
MHPAQLSQRPSGLSVGAQSRLLIHILNVGHGSCALIEHPSGRVTMMDINNGTEMNEDAATAIAESLGMTRFDVAIAKIAHGSLTEALASKGYNIGLTNPIEYLDTHIANKQLWRFVLSHPDMDHMRGLAALKDAGYGITNFWDTEHPKDPDEFHKEGDELEWAEYERLRGGSSNTVLKIYQGAEAAFYNRDAGGNAPGDGIYLLAPIQSITTEENAKDVPNYNNLSYVLYLKYGGRTVIFGGDAEDAVWTSIHQKYGKNLKCDVLIAPHHGRDSAYHEASVAAMAPEYAIVSVGKKPSTDASNKYRKHCKNVWSTRWRGNITIEIGQNGSMVVTPQYERTDLGSLTLGAL